MTKQPLPHSVRSRRKCCGLAQSDLLALLGYPPNSNKVSRIELYESEPRVSIGIALSIILDEPIENLFGGIYQKTKTMIHDNAKKLLQELDQLNPCPTARRQTRIAVIKQLAGEM